MTPTEAERAYIDIVFDGPPSHESGRFIEVEDSTGKSISFGEWVHRPDGYWALRIPALAAARAQALEEAAQWHEAQAALLYRDAEAAARVGYECADSGGTLSHYAQLHEGHAVAIRALKPQESGNG